MTANKENITKRSDVRRPLRYEEGDANFQEIINIIEDFESHEAAADPHSQYATNTDLETREQPWYETQVLSTDQTVISVSKFTTDGPVTIYLEDGSTVDFTIVNDTDFELSESFPNGTRIWIVKRDIEGNADNFTVNTSTGSQTLSEALDNRSRVVTIESFGAKGDGVTDDTAAFQAALDASQTGSVIELMDDADYVVTVGDLNANGKRVLWRGGAKVNGAQYWYDIPGTQDGFSDGGGYKYVVWEGDAGDGTRKNNRRYAKYSGGLGGKLDFIESWETFVGPDVGSSGEPKAEKAGLFKVDSESPYSNAVALMLGADARSTGPVWGLEVAVSSWVEPGTPVQRCVELKMNATDGDPDEKRHIIDVISGTTESGDPATDDVIGRGIGIIAGQSDISNGIKFEEQQGVFKNSLISAETDADFFQIYGRTTNGTLKLGTKAETGVLLNTEVRGGNSEGGSSVYFIESVQATNTTKDDETCLLKFSLSDSGTMSTIFQLNAGVGNSVSLRVGGNLKQVSQGAANSAGTGFRQLRVPN